jgi:hypothetical protein
MKQLLAFLLFATSFASMAAKPTDDDIIKQISSPNMQDIKLSKSGGTYSTYNLQHWWTRGVIYKMDAGIKEFPKAKVIVGAEARYRIVGENYDFDKLKTVWNEYEGIPLPADSEILALIKKDIVKFVESYNWNQMVSELQGPILSQDPKVRRVEWHTANSFTIHLQAKYSVVISYTEVQDKAVDYAVRFYRDGVNQAWKDNFVSSKSKENILATHKYSSDEIRAMPTQASLAAEKQAQAATAGLPSIEIPQFATDKDAIAFIYNKLRTGKKKQVEALFRAMAASGFFVEGSNVQLNSRGQETLKDLLQRAFDGKISFAESYCPQIFVQSYQTNMINIVDALKKNKSRIALTMSGGHYERGKKVGQGYKISAIDVWTLRNDDDVAQFKSWPFDELCADTAKSFQQLKVGAAQTQVPPRNSVQSNTSDGTNNTNSTQLANPAKTWHWSVFQSKYLPVSMKIIGTATEKQKMANGKLSTAMVAETNEGTFRMVATDYKQQITPVIATPTHVQFAKNFVKSNNALIHKKKVVALGTGDALDYLIERGSGEQKVMVNFRIFSHGTVVYQVMYSQYKSAFDKARSVEFMNSIKLK